MKKKNTAKPTVSKFSLLRQLCNFIPPHLVPKLARATGVEDHARTFSPWSHVVSLLYAQLTCSLGLNEVLPPLLMGTVLLAVGAGVSIYGIKTYKETRRRRLVSLGIFAAGTFFAVPLLQALFIREMDLAGWIFCILLAAASLVFFGRCYYFNRQLSK